MRSLYWLALFACSTLSALAQTNASVPAPAKSQEEIWALIQQGYQRNDYRAISGPYHLVLSFETFDVNGQPTGEGTIERFSMTANHQKTITHFRGNTMTEYVVAGRKSFTEEGNFDGNIMLYHLGEFLFWPLSPAVPGTHRVYQYQARQLGTQAMDCESYQFLGWYTYRSHDGRVIASKPPAEVECFSQETHDFILKQTEHLNGRYLNFAPFHETSIARMISVTQGSVVRARAHITMLEDAALDDAALTPPADASPVTPGSNWITETAEEEHPLQTGPLPEVDQKQLKKTTENLEVMILVSRTGVVIDAEPMESPTPELMKDALEAARKWSYKPILREGRPVETIHVIHFQ